MKWFNPVPQTAEELKKAYRALTLKHHLDVVSEDCKAQAEQDMKEINNEFDELHSGLYNVHTAADGHVYTDHRADAWYAQAVAEEFKQVIDHLVGMEGVDVEICGTWVWVSGDTYKYRAELKAAGFKWASKKRMWYWHSSDYVKRGKKTFDMIEIRLMYGSTPVDISGTGYAQLAG